MKMNGKPMVGCVIIPQPGANYVDIVDRAYNVIEDIKSDLPEDMECGIYMDDTVFIRNSCFDNTYISDRNIFCDVFGRIYNKYSYSFGYSIIDRFGGG